MLYRSVHLYYFNHFYHFHKTYEEVLFPGIIERVGGLLYPVYLEKYQGLQGKDIANGRISVDLLPREGLADSYGI